MNILMVTSEVAPYFKTGGLADMVTSLSLSLKDKNNDIRIFLPLYNNKKNDFITQFIGEADIEFPFKTESVGFSKAYYNNITFYFLLSPVFMEREGIYGDSNGLYDDTLLRQMILTKSIEKLLSITAFTPDIIHCHDWVTGLIPYYYKNKYKTVFTIHNIAHQGVSSSYEALPLGLKVDDSILVNGKFCKLINSLKSAILNSTKITTVSPSYAKEIQTEQFAEGLQEYINKRNKDIVGILNGIDNAVWNTENDVYLNGFKYNFHNASIVKKQIKKELFNTLNIEYKEDVPLVASISRLAWQKGFYELTDNTPYSALDEILSTNSLFYTLIGTGDEELENRFKDFEKRYNNFKFLNVFSEELSHRLEAASDFFLMPSKYEPCGLNQLYSLRYGSVPIVNSTGGLKDTIKDISEGKKANGFVIETLTKENIIKKVMQAIECYNNSKEIYENLMRIGMNENYDFSKSAESYINLYQSVIGGLDNEKK